MIRARALLGRLLLVPAGIVLGLVAVEIVLQAGAAIVRLAGRPEPAASSAPPRRVLALGDSYTYGMAVRHEEAYPQALQTLWNARPDVRRVEVLDLGYPGTNSSHLAAELPRMLATFRPDVVTLMVGADDWWTDPAALETAGTASRLRVWLATHSRAYRLLYMLRRWGETPRLEVAEPATGERGGKGAARYGGEEFAFAWTAAEPGTTTDWRQRLQRNLSAMVREVRAAGATPVLVTYPATGPLHASTNAVLRDVARASGTHLVDMEAALRTRCRTEKCPMLLYADGRPNPAGHLLTAEELERELRAVQ